MHTIKIPGAMLRPRSISHIPLPAGFHQFLENRQASLNHVIGDAVANAEPARAVKADAGDQEEVFLLGHFRKCQVVPIGSLNEQVECTVRAGHPVPHLGEALLEKLPIPIVSFQIRTQVRAAGNHLLPQGGGTYMAAGRAAPAIAAYRSLLSAARSGTQM